MERKLMAMWAAVALGTAGCAAGRLERAPTLPALAEPLPEVVLGEGETAGAPRLTLTRVAHSAVLLDFDGVRILTDPWFTQREGYFQGEPVALAPEALPHLDGVVASHGHYDHYDLEGLKGYPDRELPLVVAPGMAEAAREAGFTRVHELAPWQSVDVGGVKVTATPGKHGVPENTYVLEARGFTVFFGGDSLLIPEMGEIARRFPSIDLALLPVNGLKVRPLFNMQVVMTAEEAADLCALLKPRVAVPMHYRFTAGAFRDAVLLKYDGTPERFERAVRERAPATRVHVLATGQPLPLARGGASARRHSPSEAMPGSSP
jgi:L-ascorbate metabolism protein UlaG (beta-lactamase superfamily)